VKLLGSERITQLQELFVAGTVTALEVQKKNKERVNVYLDGE
jgi:hypothetical protein